MAMPAAAAEETGSLRVAHLSPDTPAVDVAVAPLLPGSDGPLTDPGTDLVTDLSYGSVSDVVRLAPGAYAVSVRAAGSARTVPPVLSARVDVPAGAARTVTLSGRFAGLALHPLSDDLSPPPPGSARVRVLAAAGAAPALDVAVRGGSVLATALPFGAAGEPRTVPAGDGTLTVAGGSGAPAEVPASFAAGSVVTLLVLDAPDGGLTVRPALDAAGPAVVPAGGVEAGTGAVPDPPATQAALAVAAAVVTALGAAGRRWRALLAVTGLAMATGACLATPSAGAAAAAGRPVVMAAVGGQQAAAQQAAGPPMAGRPAAPVRLVVPAAGVDAVLTGAGLDPAGSLVPPDDPAVAGWYTGGPVPGETGPAVIAGHVDWAGAPAVFAGVADIAPGAEVLVERADGSTERFTVTRVARYPKDAFPATAVYGPTPDAQLRLITCGGTFDRAARSYRDNVVVDAVGG